MQFRARPYLKSRLLDCGISWCQGSCSGSMLVLTVCSVSQIFKEHDCTDTLHRSHRRCHLMQLWLHGGTRHIRADVGLENNGETEQTVSTRWCNFDPEQLPWHQGTASPAGQLLSWIWGRHCKLGRAPLADSALLQVANVAQISGVIMPAAYNPGSVTAGWLGLP